MSSVPKSPSIATLCVRVGRLYRPSLLRKDLLFALAIPTGISAYLSGGRYEKDTQFGFGGQFARHACSRTIITLCRNREERPTSSWSPHIGEARSFGIRHHGWFPIRHRGFAHRGICADPCITGFSRFRNRRWVGSWPGPIPEQSGICRRSG